MPQVLIALTAFLLASVSTGCKKDSVPDPISASSISEFESRLENLRMQSKLPGMVAGIEKDGNITWTKTYGVENILTGKPVTNSTIFHLASLTKTFASVIIMQLVKENKISLSDPVSKYGVILNERDTVRIIHLLSHTSEGIPGSNFKYNGDRFALLSNVIQSATGKGFDQLVIERITGPLGLQNTAPGNLTIAAKNGFDTTQLRAQTAQGYASDGVAKVNYPTLFSTAAGLASNIGDMLNYAIAYDGNLLLTDDLKLKAFSPMISNSGKTLPYGLGWFVQDIEGIRINWHYGYWIGMSSLIIRIPEKKMSFIVMANSDMLSAPYPLGAGNIWASPYAKEFLKSFVLAGARL